MPWQHGSGYKVALQEFGVRWLWAKRRGMSAPRAELEVARRAHHDASCALRRTLATPKCLGDVRAESETSADTGFDGKLTIHPERLMAVCPDKPRTVVQIHESGSVQWGVLLGYVFRPLLTKQLRHSDLYVCFAGPDRCRECRLLAQ